MFFGPPPAVVVVMGALEHAPRMSARVDVLQHVPPLSEFILSPPEPVGLIVAAPRVPRRSSRPVRRLGHRRMFRANGEVPLPSSGTSLSSDAA